MKKEGEDISEKEGSGTRRLPVRSSLSGIEKPEGIVASGKSNEISRLNMKYCCRK